MENVYIGVDLGGTNLRVGIVDENGRILQVKQIATQADQGYELIIERMTNLIKKVKKAYSAVSIGIGSPGPLNPFDGIVVSPPNLPGWKDVPITAMIQEAIGIPTYLVNDADAAALGEALYGGGKGRESTFYITVSTGVGGGYVQNNRLMQGEHGYSAEIGNMIIQPGGQKHANMNAGSLEALASGTSIAREGQARLGKTLGAEDVFQLAKEDNEEAVKIIDEAVDALAIGIANLVHTVDPSIFILGGGVMQAKDMILPMLRKKVDVYVYEGLQGKIAIEPVQLHDKAGIIGAAMHGRQKFDDEKLKRE
ncbi:ROK family protein [Pseudalkalibacillus hwajinpoensis]|uniref:ROK family protein n=1 Tax=Guptibacillus hwajinpoensis TaxID=208199 RepID=UPI001CD35116|nr:ROK family protein [Pseudalkalibacillus hwajinpoensis]MCA0991558.1 ROK family protein [Pseudalkalibacillus hwajinpoensis]